MGDGADVVAARLRAAVARGRELFPDAEGVATADDAATLEARRTLRRVRDAARGGTAALGTDGVDAMFRRLLNPKEFVATVYRGTELKDDFKGPRSLQELLSREDYAAELEAATLQAVRSGKQVIENVKKKGAAEGQTMPPEVEAQLWPGVLREAFAREVTSMITRMSKRKQAEAARDKTTLASPLAAAAQWELLQPRSVHALAARDAPGYAVIDDFMGLDWTAPIVRDLERLRRRGRFAASKAAPRPKGAHSDKGGATGGAGMSISGEVAADDAARRGAIAWLEPRDCVQQLPAVQEVLERLHALPFELNRKASLGLQSPFVGATMASHYVAGQGYERRLDCGTGDDDQGIKVTAIYVAGASLPDREAQSLAEQGRLLTPNEIASTAEARTGAVAQLWRADAAEDETEGDHPEIVDMLPDRLILLRSRQVRNSLVLPGDLTKGRESPGLFVLTFVIHGPDDTFAMPP